MALPSTPLLLNTNEDSRVFTVRRWIFSKHETTRFVHNEIRHTKSFSCCGCKPTNRKIIRGSRLESAEQTSAGVTYNAIVILWLFGGLLGLHRFAAQKPYSAAGMLSSFLITLGGTIYLWILHGQCTYTYIHICDLGAIGLSVLLLGVIINWLKDIFFLRSWTRHVLSGREVPHKTHWRRFKFSALSSPSSVCFPGDISNTLLSELRSS